MLRFPVARLGNGGCAGCAGPVDATGHCGRIISYLLVIRTVIRVRTCSWDMGYGMWAAISGREKTAQKTTTPRMITDGELNSMTVYLGLLSMGLIVVYSLVEDNCKGSGME